MSTRRYSGKFGVSEVYPKRMFKKDADADSAIEAKAVSFKIPYSEAIQLADAIKKAGKESPESIEIKVDRRETERAVRTGLFTGTVTWLK